VSTRDTQSNTLGGMDALLLARTTPALSRPGKTATPRPITAKDFRANPKLLSNKRKAILHEIKENLRKEKSGTVRCYNFYIVFCEKLKLDPHDASTLLDFREKALDNYIVCGSNHPKSTYKYIKPVEITTQASSVPAQEQLKRKMPEPSTYTGINSDGLFALQVLGQKKGKRDQVLKCRARNDALEEPYSDEQAALYRIQFGSAGYEPVLQSGRSKKRQFALEIPGGGGRLTQQQLPYQMYYCTNVPRGIFTADTPEKCSALRPCYRQKQAEQEICGRCEEVRGGILTKAGEAAKTKDTRAVLLANRVRLLTVCSANGDGLCGKDDCANPAADFDHNPTTRVEAWNKGEFALVSISSILMCDA
jgi:hypothetical protein